MKKPLFLLLLICSVISLHSQTFKVKVVSISDGDTFTALNRDDLQIRFLGSFTSQLDLQNFSIPYRPEISPDELKNEVAAVVSGRISVELLDSLLFFIDGKLVSSKTSVKPGEIIFVYFPIFGG